MSAVAPETTLGELLSAHGLKLATAESCTGGLIGHRITNVPGSSAYFLGGVVAYSNELKAGLLGVSWQTLTRFGAVSRETALEMARGVRVVTGAEIGVSVTGIAGPDGGMPDKPVGTVWVGLSAAIPGRDGIDSAWHFTWQGNRLENKQDSAEAALQAVVDWVKISPNKLVELALMRKLLSLAIFSMLLLALLAFGGAPAKAQDGGTVYDVIAAVNALRVASDLPEYQMSSILMAVAQAHSDYQASIGQVTHTGSDGSRPVDRARAAGYNGFLSENIAGGTSLTVSGAITMWQGDAPHLETMLGANYTDIGVGVATSGGLVYYTIDVGFLAAGAKAPAAATSTAAAPKGTSGPTPLPIFAVATVTPYSDGSIIHIVQSGHTLYTIAEAYSVTVQTLLDLNARKLNDRLYVGDKIIVRAANTATPTSDATNTSTPRPPTATRRPTRTPTLLPPTTTPSFTPTVTATPTPVSTLGKDPLGNVMLGGVIVLLICGVILIAAGAVMKRKSALPPG